MADHKNTIPSGGDNSEEDEEHFKMSAALDRLIGVSEYISSTSSSSLRAQQQPSAIADDAAFDSTRQGGEEAGGDYTTSKPVGSSMYHHHHHHHDSSSVTMASAVSTGGVVQLPPPPPPTIRQPVVQVTAAAESPRRRRHRLAITCACNWGEQCHRFQQLFTQVNDPEFGGGHLIPLPVSSSSSSARAKRTNGAPSSKKNQVWEQGLRTSLGRDKLASPVMIAPNDDIDENSSSNTCSWYVAPHHFDRRQIQWIQAKQQHQKFWAESDNVKRMICRPMEFTELSSICDCIDKRFKIKQKSTKKTPKYFNLPNQTIQQVQDEIKRKVLPHLQTIVAANKNQVQQRQQQQRQQQLIVVADKKSTNLKEEKDQRVVFTFSPIAAATSEQTTGEYNIPSHDDGGVAAALSFDSLPAVPDDDDDDDTVLLVVPDYAWSFYTACRNAYRRRQWILALLNAQIITFTAATIILAVLYGHYYGGSSSIHRGLIPSFQNHCQLRTFIATIALPLYVVIVMKSRERFLNKNPNLFPAAFTRTKAEIFKFRTRAGPYHQTNETSSSDQQCKEVLATRIQDIWKTVEELLSDDAKLTLPERFWEEDHQQVILRAKANMDGTLSPSSKSMNETDLEAQIEAQPTETTPCLARNANSSVNQTIARIGDDDSDNGYLPLSIEEYLIVRLQKRLDITSSQVKLWQLQQNILNHIITILMFSTSAMAIMSLQWSIPVLLAVTTTFNTIQKNGRFDNRIAVGIKVMDGLRSAQQQLLLIRMKNQTVDSTLCSSEDAHPLAGLDGGINRDNTSCWRSQLVEEAEEIILQGAIESFL